MARELWSFFLKKLRKDRFPHVLWAATYTYHHWRWLRIQRDPERLRRWLEED